jgi:hypothetical protein
MTIGMDVKKPLMAVVRLTYRAVKLGP